MQRIHTQRRRKHFALESACPACEARGNQPCRVGKKFLPSNTVHVERVREHTGGLLR